MSEPNAQEPVETPAEQAEPSEGTQPSESTPAPNPSPETTGSEPPTIPKPRFDEVIQERNTLRERLAHYERQQQPQQQPQNDPNREPQEAEFQDFMSYQRALMRWEARQEVEQRMVAQQATSMVQNTYRSLQQKAIQEAEKDPTAYDLPNVLNEFRTPTTAYAIMSAPENTDLLRYFKTNRTEIARLSYLSPQEQLVEVGMIRAKLAGSKGQPAKVSQMPAPMNPVGAGKGGQAPEGKYTQDQVLEKLYGKPG